MKRIDKTGIVHLCIEYAYGWRPYCGASIGGNIGYVVPHDTIVTCMACLAYPAIYSTHKKTHKPIYEDGVAARDKNGYYLIACFEDRVALDLIFINDKNPSCYVCRKLK